MRRVRLGIEKSVVDIEIDDDSEAERVEALFPTYVRSPDDGEAPASISVTTDAGGGVVHAQGSVRHYESRPDLLGAVEFEATRYLLASMQEYVQLHASGAVTPRGAVIAIGPSGSGKSSVAMALHRAGHALLGDDAILLAEDGKARGFARLIKLDRERALTWGIDVERTLAFDPEVPEIWYDPREGAGWAAGVAPVSTVASVRWRQGSALRVRRLEPAEALNRMLADLLDTGQPADRAVAVLSHVASQATLLDVEFGDAREAAAVLGGATPDSADSL